MPTFRPFLQDPREIAPGIIVRIGDMIGAPCGCNQFSTFNIDSPYSNINGGSLDFFRFLLLKVDDGFFSGEEIVNENSMIFYFSGVSLRFSSEDFNIETHPDFFEIFAKLSNVDGVFFADHMRVLFSSLRVVGFLDNEREIVKRCISFWLARRLNIEPVSELSNYSHWITVESFVDYPAK